MNQGSTGRLRLAVISSPRTGNTWTRNLLSALFGLEEFAVNNPDAIDWGRLPERAVIQIHWSPEPTFRERLEAHEVRVVTLSRHPLDLLLSSLNYTTYVHLSGRCGGGGACGECGIAGRTPRSPEHMAYATAAVGSASNIFRFSREWWPLPEVIGLRYEDLVDDPGKTLAGLVDRVGQPARMAFDRVVDITSIGRVKKLQGAWHCHYWQGRPGLWKSMFPEAEARAIQTVHPGAFADFGYPCDPDPRLAGWLADLNWLKLQLDTTRENLDQEQTKRREVDNQLAAARTRLARLARIDPGSAPTPRTIARRGRQGEAVAAPVVDSPRAAT